MITDSFVDIKANFEAQFNAIFNNQQYQSEIDYVKRGYHSIEKIAYENYQYIIFIDYLSIVWATKRKSSPKI